MTSDFSVAWQCLSKRTIVFSVLIKLHAPRNLIQMNSIILNKTITPIGDSNPQSSLLGSHLYPKGSTVSFTRNNLQVHENQKRTLER
jgi:hypothetical protein